MSHRVTAMIVVAGLLGLSAACGTTGGGDEAAVVATDPRTAATTAPGGKVGKADSTVSGTGMKAGCEAVRKIFVALDVGDPAAAEVLRGTGHGLLNDVAAAEATKDIDKAMDGAEMSSALEFALPKERFTESSLATDYQTICVAKYGAAPLTNG
jgi:hypothetical protein